MQDGVQCRASRKPEPGATEHGSVGFEEKERGMKNMVLLLATNMQGSPADGPFSHRLVYGTTRWFTNLGGAAWRPEVVLAANQDS